MNVSDVKGALQIVSSLMTEKKEYLVQLDQQNGDGDLGISMSEGYLAVAEFLSGTEEQDLGKLFMQMGMIFNEKAPSSLGTITSFGMTGMAKTLRGKNTASFTELVGAFRAGLQNIMTKAGSSQGEKTILDALIPAIDALEAHIPDGEKAAFAAAAQMAADGSESTKLMKAVHGRAAYYAEKSLGVLDGGSVVGKILFEAFNVYVQSKQ
jgi:phosphoenolpyruvate---glycerone phosphotransferase subunit DhaL